MSSVSSVGQSNVAQMLQQLRSMKSSQARSTGGRPEPTAEMRQQFEARLKSMADDLGIDSSTFAKIGGQIKDAVSSTIQSNQGLSLDDMKAKLDSAINDVLTKNGVDPAEFKAKFAELQKSMGPPPRRHEQENDGDADDAGASTSATSNNTTSNNSTPTGSSQSNAASGQPPQMDITGMIARFFSHMPAGSFVDQAA